MNMENEQNTNANRLNQASPSLPPQASPQQNLTSQTAAPQHTAQQAAPQSTPPPTAAPQHPPQQAAPQSTPPPTAAPQYPPQRAVPQSMPQYPVNSPWQYAGPNVPPIVPPKTPYDFKTGDAFFALAFFIMGFCFWNWQPVFISNFALGGTLFFLACILISLVYLTWRGIRQTPKSLASMAVCLLGALPFALYDTIPINGFLLLFEIAACLFWVMCSCGTQLSPRLSGFIIGDLVNQTLIVPFRNFAGAFLSFKKMGGKKKIGRTILLVVSGVVITIPLTALILYLLMQADAGFERMIDRIVKGWDLNLMLEWILQFFLGIPVACFIFGAVFGNISKRHTAHLSEKGMANMLEHAHAIPRPAVYGPLALLNIIYILFFIAMGTYLFSAFSGQLPDGSGSGDFTYAEYARRGFFELCGIAAINLSVMAFTYFFAKRKVRSYPKPLRLLTALLTFLTALLVVTAMSKMLLYINAYSLTRLRIYTFWFMALLLLVFLALLVWHLKPFNVGRPIILIATCMVLTLFLLNTDGMIANYNVEQYLQKEASVLASPKALNADGDQTVAALGGSTNVDGHQDVETLGDSTNADGAQSVRDAKDSANENPDPDTLSIDTHTLTYMSDAVLPALYKLQEDALDPAVRAQAGKAILDHNAYRAQTRSEASRWIDWNLQSLRIAHPPS